jgi:adenosylhomocysteine nucleosidase
MILVLCALAREAAALRRLSHSGLRVEVVGMGAAAEPCVRALLERERPQLVINAGICGGLHPEWPIGRVVEPSEIVDAHGQVFQSNSDAPARLLTIDHLALSRETKSELRTRFSADLVDMEAAIIAQVSTEYDVPFRVIKAISDDAATTLPSELPAIAPHGRPHVLRLVRAMMVRPRLIRELLRLGANTNLALRELQHVVASTDQSGLA